MKKFGILSLIISILLTSVILQSCGKRSVEGKFIITLLKGQETDNTNISELPILFPENTMLAIINPVNPGSGKKVLTGDFYSASSPDISYDGKSIIFAGQQKKGDHWRIWEMKLSGKKARAITPDDADYTDPVYLPANRLAFSRAIENDSLKAGYSLFTANLDGSNVSRITYNPENFLAANVLADGRIVATGRNVFPDTGKQRLMVMRPDGTKSELFYQPSGDKHICSRIRETGEKILFIETNGEKGSSGKLVSISYNRPLHSFADLSVKSAGSFRSVFPVPGGSYLVCYRSEKPGRYGIYEFDPVRMETGKELYIDNEGDIIDVVALAAHQRPKKLPSEVDLHVKTGLLMCQNINFINPSDKKPSGTKATKIELLGINKSLGIIDAEADGSFYIKPLADSPFRIQTLDENGKVVNGPSSWIYLRPNERRGCIGCHEDMEMTPENRIAMAVRKKPVIFPVHIVKVKEKNVELE